jgi:hypothetical protein
LTDQAILIRWEICDSYGIDINDFPKDPYLAKEITDE